MKDEINDIIKFVINFFCDVPNVNQSIGIYQSAADNDYFVLLKDKAMYESHLFQAKAIEFEGLFSDKYGETVTFLDDEMNQVFNFDFQMYQTHVYNHKVIESADTENNFDFSSVFSSDEKYEDTTGWTYKAHSSKGDSDDFYSLAA
ncbi:hypothetical protein [Prevotella lacticifex]|jgi:hypothetical protein|uniref:Uncharacterized protein n=1 Tax=Prevotella lacticifex TaxID=2854755 RepID=A0A9R1C8Z8_9BACT|nr:hypothetical protein [Prevotella lacticifex]GJG37463.1 hypothetical protein PRLR5003_26200 [Prevotella lacticifex]GJG40644.1 hypothetical protein PRLR5019_26150 [Prevotella lacticifex]GJG44341.1 hypothetical protein PRLR5025_31270 [Prevotella lacticifex]GJG47026.1 hypothetical protein PRLR5027_26210 [Prevotella lacticifex]GJG50352.1 hypothetical protein PRLR5052_27650 [Prevotella lacticifex]